MPSWFDILSFDWKSAEDEKGLLESTRKITELITAEVDAGIPANRVVVGGFSQGAVISLLTGLTGERKLGGVVALSGWVPLKSKFKSMASDHARSVPVFWGHGASDPLVPIRLGTASSQFLTTELRLPTAGAESTGAVGLSWNVYQGLEHSASDEELRDLRAWVKKALPAEPSA
ncbi:alpha/beta-hydrolase [Pluteus cervinus]|uniref:Alpha/beta-hydrolase n=1 Tax=Pluteus cervinus TaxID=181527 RepID=A0ACD3AB02_9AGAR|nr:alpha/beta-hydrolase [Pluteus cervinus]